MFEKRERDKTRKSIFISGTKFILKIYVLEGNEILLHKFNDHNKKEGDALMYICMCTNINV